MHTKRPMYTWGVFRCLPVLRDLAILTRASLKQCDLFLKLGQCDLWAGQSGVFFGLKITFQECVSSNIHRIQEERPLENIFRPNCPCASQRFNDFFLPIFVCAIARYSLYYSLGIVQCQRCGVRQI